jgi:hypothetical protein
MLPNIDEELSSFILREDEYVLCLSGKWGVGKTYAWKDAMQKHPSPANSRYQGYSYVSLFGIESLQGLRSAIYENRKGPDLTADDQINKAFRALNKLYRQALSNVHKIPFSKNYVPDVSSILFATVRNITICFDDLERMSRSLDIVEVLGLVNFLKEERNCKVLIILNEEALLDKADQFKRYFEKVIDQNIVFDPTSQECASIAVIGNTGVDVLVRQYCEQLTIRNIRVIKKISSFSKNIESALQGHDKNVLQLSIKSAVIIGWCTYEKDIAPSLGYLKNRLQRTLYGTPKQKQPSTPEEDRWFQTFSKYGFTGFDELDTLIESGLKQGFLDKPALKSFGMAADEFSERQRRRSAWETMMFEFHNRATTDTLDFVQRLISACREASSALNHGEIDGTMGLLTSMGFASQAEQVLQVYLLAHDRSDPKLNINDHFSLGHLSSRFKSTLADYYVPRVVGQGIIEILESGEGFTDEQLDKLSSCSSQDYYDAFSSYSGDNFGTIVRRALEMDLRQRPEIVSMTTDALIRLAQSSALMRERIGTYGIKPENTEPPSDPQTDDS